MKNLQNKSVSEILGKTLKEAMKKEDKKTQNGNNRVQTDTNLAIRHDDSQNTSTV
jgi:hypothetical protein